MPIAAAPKYLGRSFEAASPGLRFSIYLPIWTERADQERQVKDRAQRKSREAREIQEILSQRGMDEAIRVLQARDRNPLPALWEKDDSGARQAWSKVCALNDSDRLRMRGIAARSAALSQLVAPDALMKLQAVSVAPFTTGLGNEHPLENGFSFLNPYGLPYLPGSGVKGVVRRAAEELASGDWGDSRGWRAGALYSLAASDPAGRAEQEEQDDTERLCLSMFDVLFGKESAEGEKEHFRGVLSFWDVVPEISGNSLMVEIMTPHASHYYQKKAAEGSCSPHDSGQPNPICFLTVPPGSRFAFHVACDRDRLKRIAPDLAEGDRWKQLLEAAFEHAFEWLGFGAKTAVGYGSMRRAPSPSEDGQVPARGKTASPSTPVAPDPVHKQEPPVTVWPQALLRFHPGQKQISAEFEKKTAMLPTECTDWFFQQLGPEREQTLRKKKSLAGVPVLVQQDGNKYTVVGLKESG